MIKNKKPLLNFLDSVYSQNGEDGIIKEIFLRLNIKTGWFCEFGAWDGKYGSNCYRLLSKEWKGFMIEGDKVKFKRLEETALKHENLLIENKYVEYEEEKNTLDEILEKTSIPSDFDLLSIDIDSYDYQIWDSLKRYTPKCVIIEIDSSTPPGEKYIFNGSGRLTSFSAMVELGHKKGYTLICHTGNLFFISNKYLEQIALKQDSLEDPSLLFIYDWVNPSLLSVYIRKLKFMSWRRFFCKLEIMYFNIMD